MREIRDKRRVAKIRKLRGTKFVARLVSRVRSWPHSTFGTPEFRNLRISDIAYASAFYTYRRPTRFFFLDDNSIVLVTSLFTLAYLRAALRKKCFSFCRIKALFSVFSVYSTTKNRFDKADYKTSRLGYMV